MADRRLNTSVALLGLGILILLVLGGVVIVSRMTKDPAPLVAAAEAAWAVNDYETARRNYSEALGLTSDPKGQVELLFKLTEVYKATSDWAKVLGCWANIITIDPPNLRARLGQLKYYYIMVDSLGIAGGGTAISYWNEVSSQATQLIPLAEEAGAMNQPLSQWEPHLAAAEPPDWPDGKKLLGAHLYLAKGRAAFELARAGAATNPDQSLAEAKADLTRAKALDPMNTDIYRYLTSVLFVESEIAKSRGSDAQSASLLEQAEKILAEGIEATGDAPDLHIQILAQKLSEAQNAPLAEARTRIGALEGDYRALIERFPSHPEPFSAAADFYSLLAVHLPLDAAREKLDRAIEVAGRAQSLDPNNLNYAVIMAGLQYRRFSLYGDQTSLLNAIAEAEAALEMPDAQGTPGPRRNAKQMNRLSACTLLAMFYFEQVLALDAADSSKEAILVKAERVVHEIAQIQASGDNPYVLKWKGMLELARGNTNEAVRLLYTAYAQIKAAGTEGAGDAFLSRMLATVFEGSSEIGAVVEFLGSALNSGILNTKPETLLDFADALMYVGSYDRGLRAIDSFQERFGGNKRSRQLRVRMLLSMGHISEAEEAIEEIDPADPNILKLNLMLAGAKADQLQEAIQRAAAEDASSAMTQELRSHRMDQVNLARQLLLTDTVAVGEESFVSLCSPLIEQVDSSAARGLVDALLHRWPQNVTVLFYRGVLSEPDPAACSLERRREIHLQTIQTLTDPVVRAAELGAFYEKAGQNEEAASQWRTVLDAEKPKESDVSAGALEASRLRLTAADHLFDIACRRQDWPLAEEVTQIVKAGNLDGCDGHLFAGRLDFAREQYKEALTHLDECIKLRPIFSYAYTMRGSVHTAMGNGRASVEDARWALSLNPVDPVAAKALANALLARDRDLGASVTAEQRAETEAALERAIGLNPRDTQILVAYANSIGDREPLKALAIRQTIQANAPTVNNAVMLGRLAMRLASKEADSARKQTLFSIAEEAFEQARQMDPNNQFLLESYAEYYRITDQGDKASALLAASEDGRLLWRHYYRIGRYDKARELLVQLYSDGSRRTDALKGLSLVAQTVGNKADVKRYSEELLALEDNAINRMAQVRAYLEVGLIREARHEVQSFKERYPDEPRLVLMEALLAKRQGQLSRALTLINKGLGKDPQDAAAWRLRGEIRLLMGDSDQAILDFQKSRLLRDDPETTVALAKAFVWAGRDDEAIGELQGVLRETEVPMAARRLLEQIYRRLKRYDSLDRFYTDTLTRLPDSVEWLSRAGAFAIERGQAQTAVQLCERAFRLRQEQVSDSGQASASDTQYAVALDGYLQALILSAGMPNAGSGGWHPEKLEAVLQEGQKHIEGSYAAVALRRMAEAKQLLGEIEEARDYCRQAVDRAWDNDQVAMGILLAAGRIMGAEEVERYCRQQLETHPESLAANFTMYNLARIQKDYAGAVDYIDKCIALRGSDTDEGLGYTLKKAQTLTVAHKETSDKRYLAEAIAVYKSLAAKMPTNSSILNNLAYMLAQSDQDLSEARQCVEKALADDPDNAMYLDTYAYVLHKDGSNDRAAEAIAAAIQHYEATGPAPAAAYEHLGMIKEALGEKEKALAAYRRALELGAGVVPEAVENRIRSAMERMQ